MSWDYLVLIKSRISLAIDFLFYSLRFLDGLSFNFPLKSSPLSLWHVPKMWLRMFLCKWSLRRSYHIRVLSFFNSRNLTMSFEIWLPLQITGSFWCIPLCFSNTINVFDVLQTKCWSLFIFCSEPWNRRNLPFPSLVPFPCFTYCPSW